MSKKNIVGTLSLSLIIVITVIKLLNYFNLGFMYAFGFFFSLLLIGSIYFVYKALFLGNHKYFKFSIIFSSLFSTFNTIGIFLNLRTLGYPISSSYNFLVFALLLVSTQIIILTAILQNLIYWLIDCDVTKLVLVKNFKHNKKNEKRVFWTSSLIVIAVFFIWWLILYPGILSSDSLDQVGQALGYARISNHHPAIHTFIIRIFLSIGEKLGLGMRGLGLFTLYQLILFGFLIGYVCKFLFNRGVSIIVIGLLVASVVLNPVHGIYSVTVWKDIHFAFVFCFFIVQLLILIEKKEKFFTISNIILFSTSAFLVSVMKNNGFYVVLLTAPVLIYVSSGFRKQVTLVFCSALAASMLLTGPIYGALGIKNGSVREALSIPLQQIARISRDHGDELTAQQISTINKFLDFDVIRKDYYPIISDNVKSTFNDDNFSDYKLEFVSLWISLVFQYPQTAIAATLMNTYRYWSIPNDYWIVAKGIYENSFGIEQAPILVDGNSVVQKWLNLRNMPIISDVYSLGIYLWILILLAYIYIKKYRFAYIGVFVPMIVFWLTNIASPVNGEYRYMYAIVVVTPVLIAYLFKTKSQPE